MKIGEFSKACGIPISVLRYYDEFGLLSPVYIDRFTGYRYYGEEQIAVCRHIQALKGAGFSLAEIKRLLAAADSSERERLFKEKKIVLTEMLERLEALWEVMKGADIMERTENIILQENINLPFENDEEVIGKWELTEIPEEYTAFGGKKRELYFLPNGERYWCYGWTKGKLLFSNGSCRSVNDYTLERRNGELFMTVALKLYDYPKSGKTETVTLRRVDNVRYTKAEIGRKDSIDFPFVSDNQVLGHWAAFDFLLRRGDFDPNEPKCSGELFFKEIEFFENGSCKGVYGNKIIEGDDRQVWTKGYILRKSDSTACAYEIERVDGKEYLIIEWKSGDYVWGGCEPNYYVFIKS